MCSPYLFQEMSQSPLIVDRIVERNYQLPAVARDKHICTKDLTSERAIRQTKTVAKKFKRNSNHIFHRPDRFILCESEKKLLAVSNRKVRSGVCTLSNQKWSYKTLGEKFAVFVVNVHKNKAHFSGQLYDQVEYLRPRQPAEEPVIHDQEPAPPAENPIDIGDSFSFDAILTGEEENGDPILSLKVLKLCLCFIHSILFSCPVASNVAEIL